MAEKYPNALERYQNTARRKSILSPRQSIPPLAPKLLLHFENEQQRLWFERESIHLQRLSHSALLCGDFVSAQRYERELRQLGLEIAKLLAKGDNS